MFCLNALHARNRKRRDIPVPAFACSNIHVAALLIDLQNIKKI